MRDEPGGSAPLIFSAATPTDAAEAREISRLDDLPGRPWLADDHLLSRQLSADDVDDLPPAEAAPLGDLVVVELEGASQHVQHGLAVRHRVTPTAQATAGAHQSSVPEPHRRAISAKQAFSRPLTGPSMPAATTAAACTGLRSPVEPARSAHTPSSSVSIVELNS